MSDRPRQPKQPSRRRTPGDDAIYALYDQLEDLYSILETLDELGVRTRDELIAYIDTLDAELEELESAERG